MNYRIDRTNRLHWPDLIRTGGLDPANYDNGVVFGPNGRTYMYYNGPVSYPFGYGLSYATFGYSNLKISNHNPTGDDTISVSVDVTNTSSRDGSEIVQEGLNVQRRLDGLEDEVVLGFEGAKDRSFGHSGRLGDLPGAQGPSVL